MKTNKPILPPSGWPDPLHSDALYGLPGKFVSLIDPHTESDPVAILVQFLTAYGNLIGPTTRFVVDGKDHSTNIFSVLVGQTGIARKGTSWAQVERIMRRVDEDWSQHCVKTGLSSGEGLISAVSNLPRKKKHGKGDSPMDNREEPPEKRALIIEPEFDTLLQVNNRQGNTISAVLRQGWDGGTLSTLTKEPLEAHGAHVSLVGHITASELRRDLDSVSRANGFANRFMWLCVQRSKSLPHGGRLHLANIDPLVKEICDCRTFADDMAGELIELDAEASDLWESVYDELTTGKSGLFGAMVARAAPIVRRLACLYSLLDLDVEIRVPHLLAGLALWRYAEQSAAYIFGCALGDPTADQILEQLQMAPNGMTRTEISAIFRRNKAASEISRALNTLAENVRARTETRDDGAGRPAEVWFAI